MTYQELRIEVANLLAAVDGEGMAALITAENVETAVFCIGKAIPDPGFIPNTDPGELLQDYKDLVATLEAASDEDDALQYWVPKNILLAQIGTEYQTALEIAEEAFTEEGWPAPDVKAATDVTAEIEGTFTTLQNQQTTDPCSL